jgi:HEAT repeat protein
LRLFNPDVQKMEQRKDSRGLIKCLHDKDVNIREASEKALERLGASAVDDLCFALSDKNWSVVLHAAQILGKIADVRAIQPLCFLLNKPAKAIVDYGPSYVGVPSAAGYVREAAAAALAKIGAPAVQSLYQIMCTAQSGLVRDEAQIALSNHMLDPTAVSSLCDALRHSNARVRSASASALGNIRDAKAVQPLCDALEDEDWLVRTAVAMSLGRIGDKRAVTSLQEAVKRYPDSDSSVAASKALNAIAAIK